MFDLSRPGEKFLLAPKTPMGNYIISRFALMI